jgi:hypothetical protein
MKATFAVLCLVFLSAVSGSAQGQTGALSEQSQAIANVLSERHHARLNCMRILIDNGRVVSAHLHFREYLLALRRIGTEGCPQKFRLAWLDYVQSWERRLSGRRAAENLLESVPALEGDFHGLNDIARRMDASDTDESWRHCERVALEFGVDATKPSPR